jgi:predicted MFS family arabinose efflux permease
MASEKNIRYLFTAMFFRKLMFIYAIEKLFALERGMTVQLTVYTEIIYALTIIMLSVPSGILADKFGRKRLIVLGALFACFETGVLIFAHNFWLFGFSALIAGFGGAFKSGTWNALLYDSLLSCGKQDDFEKYLGRMRVVDYSASLIAGVFGAFLSQWFDFAFSYWLSTGSAFIALLFTLKLSEPPKYTKKAEHKANMGEIVFSAFNFFKSNHDVLKMLIHVALITSIVIYVDEYWQVYLNDISFPIMLFGIVYAVLTVIQIPGALLASKMLKICSHRVLIIVTSFMTVFGILGTAFVQHPVGVVGIAIVCFAIAFIEPIAAGYLHHRADPAARATIESTEKMIQRVFTIGIGLAFGYLSTRFSIFTGFWLLGLTAAFASVVYSLCKIKK